MGTEILRAWIIITITLLAAHWDINPVYWLGGGIVFLGLYVMIIEPFLDNWMWIDPWSNPEKDKQRGIFRLRERKRKNDEI